MKNIHSERLRRSAKQFHRDRRGTRFQDGVVQIYDYDGKSTTELTWWTDVLFIANGFRVMLYWTHPRLAYQEQCEAMVPYPNQAPAPCSSKAIPTKIESAPGPTDGGCNEIRQSAIDKILRTSSVQIAPHMHVRWGSYAKVVSLCVPLEVRSRDDMLRLVQTAKGLLRREVSLAELFPAYLYDCGVWAKEIG